jgi:putative ATPase
MNTEQNVTQMFITNAFLQRLFTPNSNQSSYAERLSRNLTRGELENIKMAFTQYLLNQTVNWETTISFLKANRVC